ncbi:unnamed protein product [Lactuca saligna]|uniref:Putative zinc-finger domain-containing protein n=1 Tax=Lactuca saligna TaxID=75948 RepID=A0AA36ENV5_LACSI|nr:unnamed protein product [Lactuca saligna]
MENTTTTSPSPPTTSNHDTNAKFFANSSKTREEGELSASENDEFAGSQFPYSTTLPRVPLNKDAYMIGKSGLTRNSTYSDDDSGSDSEEHMENTIESDDMTRGVMENRKLPISVGNRNPQIVQKFAKTNTKVPKKLSKSNAPSKNKVGPNVHINSSKLQDLRQLIAIRENELKKASSSIKNMNSKGTVVRSRDSTEIMEPKEPEKKRLKVTEPPTNTQMSVDQQDRPPTESTFVLDISAPESDGPKGRYDGSYSEKDTTHPSVTQQTKKVRNHNMPLTNLPSGTGIIKNSRRHNRITNMVESSTPLVAKTTKTSPHKQARLKNPTFWNHFGPTNISETADMDLKSLLEIEEQQDKELDEAQEHRRKCEIEERNALKAYRKAQRALAEANTKCSYLYHKRELFSANLRSHVMEDSTMFWSNSNMPVPRQHTGPKLITTESCGEPDTSTSDEPQEEEEEEDKTNDVCSSLHDDDDDVDDDEQTSAFELKAADSSLDEGTCSERSQRTKNENSISVVDPTEDSLLLEATLRSQLFARLGNRIPKKMESGQSQNMEVAVEREDGEITEASGNFYGSLTDPILRSAFSHVKLKKTDELKIVNEEVCGAQHQHQQPTEITDFISNSKLDIHVGEIGSYSNNLPINPSWPLCMFELRGKCNNDECPWQHLKDYSSNDGEGGLALKSGNGCVPLAPPTYLVCLDSLKAESHPYKYLLAQTVEQRWQKYFSASLVVSTSFLVDLHSDEPYLHGPETRIEVHGGWNRQSSYFHTQNLKEGLPDQHMDDTDQPLEMALLKLTRDVNKQKGRREALIVLARALEEHPTSVLLWIVYLHIYYSNQKSIGKDDLFHYAVEHNDSSYELWLMFINSREKLDDRLHGYNTAMSALSRHAIVLDFNSACILDLFLQMINCLVSSGKVNNAIRKVYDLIPSTKNPSDFDIQSHLTTSDKYVLWICSIYLIMYKKLPETILQQFECPKELPGLQWHSVNLTPDEKQQVVALMELISDSLTLEESHSHLFALNHIRCTAVLEGFESTKNLLNRYLQLYPSSMELVLLSIRVNEFDSVNVDSAFEHALTNWAGKPGVQCIWNQYAENALRNEKTDFAKEIMERWVLNSSSQSDVVFGLLNLSLHKQLQNEHTEAQIAIQQALEVASVKDYIHCVSEHAMFFQKNRFDLSKPVGFLTRLNRYVTDSRATRPQEPLSRSFIKTIKNPKIQKLINNLLSPVSSDFSLMNTVLESCFGPRLVPFEVSEKAAEFVDFVEGLMELRPGNYELALSLCKMLTQSGAGIGISISNSNSNINSVCFWAGSVLMNCLFQAVPVAPESVWVEAGGVLGKMLEFKSILESFHKRALLVYPCSLKLWKSYLGICGNEGNSVIEMAREKGINL